MIRKMGGIQCCKNIHILVDGERQIITNSENVEIFAETFAKVHINGNISEDMRLHKDKDMRENPNILVQRGPSENMKILHYKLKQALAG